MTQTQIQVVITTAASYEATADDAVLLGQGAAAYTSIKAGRDIYIDGGDGTITFIPYQAIDHAVITIAQATVDDPEDATCPAPADEEEPGEP